MEKDDVRTVVAATATESNAGRSFRLGYSTA